MKILFYSTYYTPYISGVTTTSHHIVQHLQEKHDVTVLTFKHTTNLKDREKQGSAQIIRMPWNIRVSKGFISLSSLDEFTKQIQKTDVVMVNAPNVEALPLIILAKIFKKKTITLFHCDIFLGSDLVSLLITAIVRFVVFIELALSNAIVAYPDYLTHHPYSRLFKHRLKTCLPVAVYEEVKTKEYKDSKVAKIGFVGRIAREKGIELIIEAIDSIKNSINIELEFVGPEDAVGEDEYRKQIVELLDKKKISYRILGMLSSKELASFYQSIDLLVLSSTNSTEAIGIVQMEAMMYGTPVIAPKLPGVRLPIQLTGMGVTFKPRDADSLSKAIRTVLSNRDEYVGKEKQKKALGLFDKDKVFSFYDRLLT